MSNQRTDVIIDPSSLQNAYPSIVLHHLPCRIQYDGPAKVLSFFRTTQAPLRSGEMYTTFRGRMLRGRTEEVPQEYKIVVLRDVPQHSESVLHWSVRGVAHSLTVWTRHTDNDELHFVRSRANRYNTTNYQCSDSLTTTSIITKHKDIEQIEDSESDVSAPVSESLDFIVTHSSQPDRATPHAGRMDKSVFNIARRWIDLARVIHAPVGQTLSHRQHHSPSLHKTNLAQNLNTTQHNSQLTATEQQPSERSKSETNISKKRKRVDEVSDENDDEQDTQQPPPSKRQQQQQQQQQ